MNLLFYCSIHLSLKLNLKYLNVCKQSFRKKNWKWADVIQYILRSYWHLYIYNFMFGKNKATCEDELTFAVRNEFMDFLLPVCKIHERVQVQWLDGLNPNALRPHWGHSSLFFFFLFFFAKSTHFLYTNLCGNVQMVLQSLVRAVASRGIDLWWPALCVRRNRPECKWIRFQYKIKNGPRCVLVGCCGLDFCFWCRAERARERKREMNNSWWWLEPPCCILRAQWLGMAITMDKKRMLCWHLTDGCEIITQKAPASQAQRGSRETAGAHRKLTLLNLLKCNFSFTSAARIETAPPPPPLFLSRFWYELFLRFPPAPRAAKLMAAERVERKTR